MEKVFVKIFKLPNFISILKANRVEISITSLVVFFGIFLYNSYNNFSHQLNEIAYNQEKNAEANKSLSDYLDALKTGQDSIYNKFCAIYKPVIKKIYNQNLDCDKVNKI